MMNDAGVARSYAVCHREGKKPVHIFAVDVIQKKKKKDAFITNMMINHAK